MRFKETKYGDLSGQEYNGNIDVSGLGLTSLEGCPKKVIGDFNCSDNDLLTLEYGAKELTGYYDFSNNQLTSLLDLPSYFWERLNMWQCCGNDIRKIENIPEHVGVVEGLNCYEYYSDRYYAYEADLQRAYEGLNSTEPEDEDLI